MLNVEWQLFESLPTLSAKHRMSPLGRNKTIMPYPTKPNHEVSDKQIPTR